MKAKEALTVMILSQELAWMYTIEWQNESPLTLIWCKVMIRPENIDGIICAELPNPEQYMIVDIIKTQIIHGACGVHSPRSLSMEHNKCIKSLPREFIQETHTGHDHYPLYRRRKLQDGRNATKLKVNVKKRKLTNCALQPTTV